jgi:hypothetical protein
MSLHPVFTTKSYRVQVTVTPLRLYSRSCRASNDVPVPGTHCLVDGFSNLSFPRKVPSLVILCQAIGDRGYSFHFVYVLQPVLHIWGVYLTPPTTRSVVLWHRSWQPFTLSPFSSRSSCSPFLPSFPSLLLSIFSLSFVLFTNLSHSFRNNQPATCRVE